MGKRKPEAEGHENGERWLITYSDMITLLLVLFIMLYAISSVDSKKYQALSREIKKAFNAQTKSTSMDPNLDLGTGGTPSISPTGDSSISPAPGSTPAPDPFDNIYKAVLTQINAKGLGDKLNLIKGENSILFRFEDSILFFPDSAKMTAQGIDLMNMVSTAIKGVTVIDHVQIDGHTAKVSNTAVNGYFSWQLSADRAITVLEYLDKSGAQPQSKMSISGYSCFRPLPNATGNTEADRSHNRRVEILITRPSATK